jgi:hypothetical protein
MNFERFLKFKAYNTNETINKMGIAHKRILSAIKTGMADFNGLTTIRNSFII